MKCEFGRDAIEGDYVLVMHRTGYGGKDVRHYIGRVHRSKVYTGIRTGLKNGQPVFLHKTAVLTVVPYETVTPETILRTQRDLAFNFPDEFAMPTPEYTSIEDFLENNNLGSVGNIEKAFSYCKNTSDIGKVCTVLNSGYGGEAGTFSYFVSAAKPNTFQVIAKSGINHEAECFPLPFETKEFKFANSEEI